MLKVRYESITKLKLKHIIFSSPSRLSWASFSRGKRVMVTYISYIMGWDHSGWNKCFETLNLLQSWDFLNHYSSHPNSIDGLS